MSRVRAGEPWGRPVAGPADAEVPGDDAALAAVAARRPGVRALFRPAPASDLACTLGLPGPGDGEPGIEVPVDGLELDREPGLALNAVVLGTPPDRMRWWSRSQLVAVTVDGRDRFAGPAVAVVIANGQYLRGEDVAPRGHPGDGRAEIQVYKLGRSERQAMRRRLPQGAHVPHPRIQELSGRRVEVRIGGGSALLEADGVPCGRVDGLAVDVIPAAVWLLV